MSQGKYPLTGNPLRWRSFGGQILKLKALRYELNCHCSVRVTKQEKLISKLLIGMSDTLICLRCYATDNCQDAFSKRV